MAEHEREVIVTNGGGGGSGVVIAVVLLIALLVGLYLFFGTNLIRGSDTNINVNVAPLSTGN